jgi:uncharacterized protein with von Willebrand factor type A (vWA) domain
MQKNEFREPSGMGESSMRSPEDRRKALRNAGGVIHTYQAYDPKNIPGPSLPLPDLVSAAMDHLLTYGELRELTEEELARAVRIDPSQIVGLGLSLRSLLEMLRQRKKKILETYETEQVLKEAAEAFRELAAQMRPPRSLAAWFSKAVAEEQLHDLERIWYHVERERPDFAGQLIRLTARLGAKYQIEEMAAKYHFTGRTPMTVPQALEIKEELEKIDRLIKQLEEALKTARLGVIDLNELAEFASKEQLENLRRLGEQIKEFLRQLAEMQGLERGPEGYRLTPKAFRIFQGYLLERIFSQLQAARTGRHQGPIVGEGAIELQQTKPYEFGDSLANMDIASSFINALVRQGPGTPVHIQPEDILIHRTRNRPKCATVVLLDMSGSMRYADLYVHAKRMGLALHGLITKEFPGDYLQFVEIATFAKIRHISEIPTLMPRNPTLFDPIIRLRADMSDPDITEMDIPPHFTNIQHGLEVARRLLSSQDTSNRQIILITDGMPTAHFEGSILYLLYPPHRETEAATLREGQLCRREGIVINIFLLPTWGQSSEDVQFAYRLARETRGRVFFTAGRDLDRYVIWDYLSRRREILG